ncbi:MAG TPA: helix-turn-helix domain-containing protein [Thermomicrobiales bacterium]|jgi:transcriptional regulator with XRE-family HTH domain|nr:helix-turn-helix domain-containing protein [Thermomicrobiales bacterium]
MSVAARPIGELLREWRERRRLSQLALALAADVSARHVSFIETGRSRPSRDMVLRLAERLDVPLRERNRLLLAAGYAPAYPERDLADPDLAQIRQAVDLVLAGHEPYPALAVDRHWHLVAANRAIPPLLAGVAPALLAPPVNVLRLSLDPAGLAPRIVNLPEWRAHLLERLRRQADVSADPALAALLTELRALPVPASDAQAALPCGGAAGGPVVPLRLRTDDGLLSLLSATTVFGAPLDVTASELAIEAFYPADPATADRLRRMSEGSVAGGSPRSGA